MALTFEQRYNFRQQIVETQLAVITALQNRQSAHEFSTKKLIDQGVKQQVKVRLQETEIQNLKTENLRQATEMEELKRDIRELKSLFQA